MIKVTLNDRLFRFKAEASGEDSVVFEYDKPYGFEDELLINVEPNSFVKIDLDPHIKPSIIYTPTGYIKYIIPVNWKT